METLDPTYAAVRALVDRNRQSLANHQRMIKHAREHVASSRGLLRQRAAPARGAQAGHHLQHAQLSHRGEHLVRSLEDFIRSLAVDDDVEQVLRHIVEHVTGALRIKGASLRLSVDDGVRIVAAGHGSVGTLEEFQSDTGLGPAVTAADNQRIVRVFDVAQDENREAWPLFAQRAAELDIVSLACIPLSIDDTLSGSLDLYDARAQLWTHLQLTFARAVGEAAAARIRALSERDDLLRLTQQLQQALDSRVKIEQAKGMLACANDVSMEEAFNLLRSHARSHSVRLLDVAADVVASRRTSGAAPALVLPPPGTASSPMRSRPGR